MKKSKLIAIIVGLILVISGAVVAVVGLASMGFNFKSLALGKTVDSSYELTEDFSKINVETNTSDVHFIFTDGASKVEVKELEKQTHNVSVSDGVLNITHEDQREWYDHITLFTPNVYINVYLNKTEFENLAVETDTGDVNIEKAFSFSSVTVKTDTGDVAVLSGVKETLSISVDTGEVIASGITAKNATIDTHTGDVRISSFTLEEQLKITGTTGDVYADSVNANSVSIETDTGDITLSALSVVENMSVKATTGEVTLKDCIAKNIGIETDTGDVELYGCDAESLNIKTSTGDVEGVLLTEKTFITDTSTGEVEVPRGTSGGRCEITTSTGDIEISIKN
ncbi:MAG: DUF4097 family beta strand repeat protein [Clostridia bacterium]|nr:DUF4097 family beta strand repeat protein [Clostridia bacterium]